MTTAPESSAPTVEVFWRPGCPYCSALRRDLARRGVPAVWLDIWADEQARAFVRSVNNGDETVPTVRVGSTTMTNPSGAQVARLLGGDAPLPQQQQGEGGPSSTPAKVGPAELGRLLSRFLPEKRRKID